MHVDLDTRTVREGRRRVEGVPAAQPVAATGGIIPKITDAELITVAVMQVLLGFHDQSRWIRYARKALIHLFPYLPKQPGYNSGYADRVERPKPGTNQPGQVAAD